ncbi:MULTISPECIES: CaiB/BaiF CoA-transferase family protein [Bradyrhizobium]|uniref:CaiB/BaiF CoA transferase family protein n=1 Tax=Bradyrhizobium TaxID=374 RepID=UPI001AD7C416|nr:MULTISPECIES: CoA transferase [Bradyrhizobium]MBO4227116.1 CoA transferase [Bradyrhizobium neotropicale]MCA1455846.1 CoA transferase [Bradyrhizobium sp. BRP22]
MSLPLTGIRVLDLSIVLAGPFCCYHLSRLGAEVIKVENPNGGDLARRLGADPERAERLQGLSFVSVNAGKQSVALNLKSEAGSEAFLRLVSEADVLVENFRPNVMERLGLGFDALCRRNPRLVYCAISGFGQNGPWSARPAYDQIVQGLSGAMSLTGDAATAPLRAGFPISDTLAGLTAAFAIAAALVEQQQTGRGRFIDVSLLEATISAMGWVVSNHLNGGVEPRPMGNENFTAAPSGTFCTATGPLNIAANEQKQYRTLCDLIGRPDLKTDPRFAKREARKLNRGALNFEVNAALSCRPAEEWEALLNAAGVPAGCVLTVPQILREAQLLERGFVETLPRDGAGEPPLRITRPGFRLDEAFLAPALPPSLGADTERWLARLGYSDSEIDHLIASGAAGTLHQEGAHFPRVRPATDGAA